MQDYIPDSVVWAEACGGDISAFEVLFYRYADSLLAYGLKFTADRDNVKDMIQNLFLRLMTQHDNLSHVENVKSYLFTAFRRSLIRSMSVSSEISFDSSESLKFHIDRLASADEDSGLDDEMLQQRQRLYESLLKLSSRQKEALYLRYVQRLPMERIAFMLNMNNQSVRNLLHRAIEKLRESMGPKSPASQSILLALLIPMLS